MADLVRYWYAALFLFASAYTLYDEGHVRVDVVYAGLSDKVKAYVNAWGSYLLGVVTTVVIVVIGFNGKTSIINSPLLVFEITNQGINGMFIKYQMAMFLGIFGATMMLQFIVQFLELTSGFGNRLFPFNKGKQPITGLFYYRDWSPWKN